MERTPQGLQVSPKGKQLLELVNPSLVTPELTESWEKDLEAIAAGKKQAEHFLKEIEKETKRLVQEIKTSKQTYQDFSITQKKCPECGSNLREKNTRDGKIYVCTNQDCDYRRRKDPKCPITVVHNVIVKWKLLKVRMELISVANMMVQRRKC